MPRPYPRIRPATKRLDHLSRRAFCLRVQRQELHGSTVKLLLESLYYFKDGLAALLRMSLIYSRILEPAEIITVRAYRQISKAGSLSYSLGY